MIKQELTWLWEDIREAFKDTFATAKTRWMIARELESYEYKKFTSPMENFKITVATVIVFLLAFGIIGAMFMYSTETYYTKLIYGYDTATQELVILDE